MPNIIVCKTDKIYALEGMINAKFRTRYKKLTERQSILATRVYNETYGKIGNQLKELSGENWRTWLTNKSRLFVKGCAIPELIVESGKNRSKDLFTGLPENRHKRKMVTLKNGVAWPANIYKDDLMISDATKPTQRVAATLDRDIKAFNTEVKEFYSKAYSVLMQLRSSKRIDEMFPELWQYLPVGIKERAKQAIVAISQADVDALRSQLPNKVD